MEMSFMSSMPMGMRLGGVPSGPGHHRIDHCFFPAGSGESREEGHRVPDAGRLLCGGHYMYIYTHTRDMTLYVYLYTYTRSYIYGQDRCCDLPDVGNPENLGIWKKWENWKIWKLGNLEILDNLEKSENRGKS